MYCKKCGQEIDKSVKFCPHCGAVVTTEGKKSKKTKAKKPFYKRWWFWAIVIILLLGSCGSDGETASGTSPTTEIVETQAIAQISDSTKGTTGLNSATSFEITADAEATTASDISIDTALSLIESTIKDSFTNYNVSHEDGIITINVWEDGIAVGAMFAAAGDAECLESWNELVENQQYFCNSILNLIKTLGFTDISVVVNVLNDGNTDNVLLSTINGVVLYDSVNE